MLRLSLLFSVDIIINEKYPALYTGSNYLYQLGFGIADAAHLAYAEILADVFISCDDKLLKKYKKEVTAKIIAVNPLEFVSSEELQ
jgi:predicted nucleic acid-binding protein